jgi:hypothetical protein
MTSFSHHLNFRAARAAITSLALGLGVLGFSAAANAQQLATNDRASPACATIKNDLAAIKCEVRESERRTNEAKARAAAAQTRSACLDTLESGIKSKNYSVQAVRTVLAGKSIREVDPCSVLQQLKKS